MAVINIQNKVYYLFTGCFPISSPTVSYDTIILILVYELLIYFLRIIFGFHGNPAI